MESVFDDITCGLDISFVENFVGGDMVYMHYHDAYEIYILERGSRNYIIDNALVELGERDVALVNPYEIHTTGGGKYRRHLISIKRGYLEQLYSEDAISQILQCFKCRKIHLGKASCERVIALLDELRRLPDDVFLFTELMGIFNSCAEGGSIAVSPKNQLVSEIIEYIASHYRIIKNLDEIAENFYITRFYLCRLFKENTGVSVIKYVNSLKLQSACEMLSETKKTVEEIGTESGFNSSMYFCKVFKSVMNMTPSQYRKRNAVNK